MQPIESFTVDEGTDVYGVRKQVMFDSEQIVTKLTYDAEPMLEQAAAERAFTAGDRWGEMRKVGVIPMVVLNDINTRIQGAEERKFAIVKWLKENPRLVSFNRFLK